jgi:hypothetical protein
MHIHIHWIYLRVVTGKCNCITSKFNTFCIDVWVASGAFGAFVAFDTSDAGFGAGFGVGFGRFGRSDAIVGLV